LREHNLLSTVEVKNNMAHVGVLGRAPEIQKQGGFSIEGSVSPDQKDAVTKAKDALNALAKEVDVRA